MAEKNQEVRDRLKRKAKNKDKLVKEDKEKHL